MKLIAVSGGPDAMVDEADYARLSQYSWATAGKMKRPVRQGSSRSDRVYMQHDVIGFPPEAMVVDHINGNRFDNRRCNLRFASIIDNNCNRRVPRKPDGCGKGVARIKHRFSSEIGRAGLRYKLGSFNTRLEAEFAYDAAAIWLHGDFAVLNHPMRHTVGAPPWVIARASPPERNISQIETLLIEGWRSCDIAREMGLSAKYVRDVKSRLSRGAFWNNCVRVFGRGGSMIWSGAVPPSAA